MTLTRSALSLVYNRLCYNIITWHNIDTACLAVTKNESWQKMNYFASINYIDISRFICLAVCGISCNVTAVTM